MLLALLPFSTKYDLITESEYNIYKWSKYRRFKNNLYKNEMHPPFCCKSSILFFFLLLLKTVEDIVNGLVKDTFKTLIEHT